MGWFHYKSVVKIASNPLVGVILQYLAVFDQYLTSIPVIPVNTGKYRKKAVIPGYCSTVLGGWEKIPDTAVSVWYFGNPGGKNTGAVWYLAQRGQIPYFTSLDQHYMEV